MESPRPGVCATEGDRILLRATKFDGAPHWIQPFTVISDDGNLLVAKYRARTPIYTSRGEFRSPYDSCVYFWRDRWFNVFRLSRPRCGVSLWYCNVTTPPVLEGSTLRYVDLDLDVSVRPDGCIELLDADEFEQHRELYAYPVEVVEAAQQAAQFVAAMAQRHEFPFNLTATA